MNTKVIRNFLFSVGPVDKKDSPSSLALPPCPTRTNSLVQFARTAATASLSQLPVTTPSEQACSSPRVCPDFMPFGLTGAESVDDVRVPRHDQSGATTAAFARSSPSPSRAPDLRRTSAAAVSQARAARSHHDRWISDSRCPMASLWRCLFDLTRFDHARRAAITAPPPRRPLARRAHRGRGSVKSRMSFRPRLRRVTIVQTAGLCVGKGQTCAFPQHRSVQGLQPDRSKIADKYGAAKSVGVWQTRLLTDHPLSKKAGLGR
jgi:hypothetical protein